MVKLLPSEKKQKKVRKKKRSSKSKAAKKDKIPIKVVQVNPDDHQPSFYETIAARGKPSSHAKISAASQKKAKRMSLEATTVSEAVAVPAVDQPGKQKLKRTSKMKKATAKHRAAITGSVCPGSNMPSAPMKSSRAT